MDVTIPEVGHRLTIPFDSRLLLEGADGSEVNFSHNEKIVEFARSLDLGKRYVSVEVFYESPDDTDELHRSTTEDNYDAVTVDTEAGVVVATLPPYSEIDPDWQQKREASHE